MTASAARSMLPPLTPEERAHSETLAQVIRGEVVAAGGWLSFERFMELALYAPGLGYYSAGAVKLGPAGTSSPPRRCPTLFSRCLARQMRVRCSGAPAGRSSSWAPAPVPWPPRCCRSWRRRACCPSATPSSKSVRTWPRASARDLGHAAARTRANAWYGCSGCPRSPLRGGPGERGGRCAAVPALHLPGRWRARAGRQPRCCRQLPGERGAGGPGAGARVRALFRELGAALPDGYLSELSLAVDPWVQSIAGCLRHGAFLLFDYGLPRATTIIRNGSTARCAATSGNAPTMIPTSMSACRTSPPGSTSRAWPRPRSPRVSTWRASATQAAFLLATGHRADSWPGRR